MSLKRFALKAIIIMLVIVFGLTLMASLGLSLIDLSNDQSSAYHTHLPPNNCPEGQHLCLERDDTREIIGTYCKIGSCKDES